MLEGRTKEQKAKIVAEITDTMVRILGVNPEIVHIVINENPKENVGRAGVLISDRKK
jgi:4-oxalocrotonate tautomerase